MGIAPQTQSATYRKRERKTFDDPEAWQPRVATRRGGFLLAIELDDSIEHALQHRNHAGRSRIVVCGDSRHDHGIFLPHLGGGVGAFAPADSALLEKLHVIWGD